MRHKLLPEVIIWRQFQSTHPSRGATRRARQPGEKLTHFNPRTPRGVRREAGLPLISFTNFNPRTPRGVRPAPSSTPQWSRTIFQSTHPSRGATRSCALRCFSSTFQSTHPSRGATLPASTPAPLNCIFQSTHPSRGATAKERRKPVIFLYLFHKDFSDPVFGFAKPASGIAFFVVRSPTGIHGSFGFAHQIMSTPSGS